MSPLAFLTFLYLILCINTVEHGIYAWNFNPSKLASVIKDHTYCQFNECCNDDHIQLNIEKLDATFKERLFGQHIVHDKLVRALRAHFDLKMQPDKALALSFHGTPGVGKTFVANLIAETMYKRGIKSAFVHRFYGRADFPDTNNALEYRNKILDKVRAAIRQCPRSLFIFDEVNQMPGGVFESLTSMFSGNHIVDGVEGYQAVYVFLSNLGALQLSEQLGKLMHDGVLREDTMLEDFEKILEKGAYNLMGGMKSSSLIDEHAIDHFLPFLPLEKKHVVQCLEQEYRRRNLKPNSEHINRIISTTVTFEKQYHLFATSGCKRLASKVVMLLDHPEL